MIQVIVDKILDIFHVAMVNVVVIISHMGRFLFVYKYLINNYFSSRIFLQNIREKLQKNFVLTYIMKYTYTTSIMELYIYTYTKKVIYVVSLFHSQSKFEYSVKGRVAFDIISCAMISSVKQRLYLHFVFFLVHVLLISSRNKLFVVLHIQF